MHSWKERVSDKLTNLFSDSSNSPKARSHSKDGSYISSVLTYIRPSSDSSPNKNDKHLKPIQSLPNRWKDKDISYQHIPLDTYDEDDDTFNPREQNTTQSSVTSIKSENKEVSNVRDENGDQGSEISTSSSEAFEDATKPTTMTTVIDLNIDSLFISPELYQCLQSSIPNIVKGCQWVLLYSTVKHGISLRTLIRKSADLSGPSLLITGDTQGAVFGGLVNCPLNPTPKRKYQGTYETFVFTTLYGAPRLFRPTGYNIKELVQEAQFRWLRPAEVLFILQNYEETQLNHEPPQKPPSGSLFLFNKRVLRFFRKDGHNWRRKKDGKNVGEAHERLKVGNDETLNCYYAHNEDNPHFRRRCYWMLDSAMEHIVLVHYRDTTIGKHSAGPITASTLGSSNIIQSSNNYATQPAASEFDETYNNSTPAPTFLDDSPGLLTNSNGASRSSLTERIDEIDSSPELQIDEALKKIQKQLSLEQVKDNRTFYNENEYLDDLGFTYNEQNYSAFEEFQYGSDNSVSLQYPVLDIAQDQINTSRNGATDLGRLHQYQQPLEDEFKASSQQNYIWKDMLTYDGDAAYDGSLQNFMCPSDTNEALLSQQQSDPVEELRKHHSGDTGTSYESSILPSQELEDSTFPSYIPTRNMYQSDADIYSTLFDQGQIGTPLASDSSLTIAQEQKFKIREICPEWVYATEPSKVLIVGTFTCDPQNTEWICMFGDTEVPVEIIQEGVISCHAPPHTPGKVTICITSGNREACSEVREFEYRDKPHTHVHNTSTENEISRSSEELRLLVKFVQTLLSNKIGQKGSEESWNQIIEALTDDSLASSRTTDWLLEELLKDKLETWLSSKLQDNNTLPALSKGEQGIIHMVSGLGFVWALAPILKCGVGINFRDVNGWTALHWASRFGREKMVAELLASGAYPGAVTDPSQKDPTGQTAASIAETHGHKGLAAYLSEAALTSHLSSLTLKESELSKCSADVEAERTVNSISNQNLVVEDHLSLKDAIAAVRNAAQAASRIQAAFRAHSFKKRKQKEAAERERERADEYGLLPSDIEELSAVSKLNFGNARYHNAALAIQKKYRGWKGRKDYLTLRKKVVKIQAHVRGHQARKNYEAICWAVGIVEKIILRWHRKRVGLRGFHLDSIDETADEDIAKIFRKQRVDVALAEAVSRVLSMVNSTPARQQYRRMLQKYQQAKAEQGGRENEGGTTSQLDAAAGMETEEFFDFV